jgi:eukaryotic-like serine/threonine-protein kinase
MDPAYWRRVEEIYQAAAERKPEERAVFLAVACGGDEDLRREVESLLAQPSAEGILDRPAWEPEAGGGLPPDAARQTVGQLVSHYEIQKKVGEGGMGAVYRAYDTQLRRPVALKVLPPEYASDPERREGLLREARVASALNHPNIVGIHEVGSDNGVDFIAMEFVEGKCLGDVIPGKGLPLEKALDYAVQIAGGLAKANAAGVVHRDLKPGNIMLTPDGLVKLLDFGLARRVELGEGHDTTLTVEGEIAGTPSYMSPEQAQGKPVDARSDVFSFGSVLYQMVTGRRAFEKDSHISTLAAVVEQEPRPLPSSVPRDLKRIIARCLRKDPAHRFQHMDDVKVELEELKQAVGGTATLVPHTSRNSVGLGLGIMASVIVLLIALNVGRLRERVLGRANTPRITSLAVLPVKNFSGDPSQEFFADGMTDALVAGLAQIKAVDKIISRTSVMQYKDAKKSLPQIARELGVDGIVEASVMRFGGRVRVTAQLIEARQDRHLWANTYEREMTDVLALQSELVQAIAGEIRVQVTPQESERLKTARRVDPEVYEATLKGKATLEYATREGELHQAIELFQKAIDRDPTYAPAWAGLGEAMWSLAGTGWEFVAPGEVRDKAIAAAEKALELDETLPDAHKARAVIAFDGEWDVAKAQQQFERALELRPGYAAAHNLYGQMLSSPLLRFDEARRHYDRARELDPLSPWNDINLGWWWLYQGRPERALEEGERARRRHPTIWVIRWYMGFAQLLLGQPSQAVPEFDAALELLRLERPAAVLAPLGLAYGLAGRRTDALRILAEMEHASQKGYISPVSLAVVYSGLGRMDEAFRLLDQALEQRTPSLVWCTPYAPDSVALRRDPRWKPFIDRLRRLVRLPPGTSDPYS